MTTAHSYLIVLHGAFREIIDPAWVKFCEERGFIAPVLRDVLTAEGEWEPLVEEFARIVQATWEEMRATNGAGVQ